MKEKSRLKDIPIVELRNLLMLLGLYVLTVLLDAIHVFEFANGLYSKDCLNVQTLMTVIILIITTAVHLKYPKSKYRLGYVSVVLYLCLYFYTLCTANNVSVYVYIIPFLVLLLIYDNTILLVSTAMISTMLTAIVYSTTDLMSVGYSVVDIEVSVITLVLTTLFLLMSRISVLRAYNRLNKLEKELLTDTLTRCNNRKFLEQLVDNGFFNKKGVSVIIGDINDFKGINDTYGHVNGDIALVCVGKILRDVCDRYDNTWEVRLGGDEFIIVTDKEFTDKIIEECRQAFAADKTIKKLDFEIVISFGQAKNETGKLSWQQLYELADQEMYSEKEDSKR